MLCGSQKYKEPSPVILEIVTYECITNASFRTVEEQIAKNIIWRDSNGKIVKRNVHQINNISPGEYSLEMTLDGTPVEKINFTVEQTNTCSLLNYVITDSSGILAWDGRVDAIFDKIPKDAEFFWSNGEKTQTPMLENIQPGKYTVTVVSDYDIIFIHKCSAAIVGIA